MKTRKKKDNCLNLLYLRVFIVSDVDRTIKMASVVNPYHMADIADSVPFLQKVSVFFLPCWPLLSALLVLDLQCGQK